MAEILPKGSPLGIVWTTAVATGASTSFDLTAYAGRYVKIMADQDCYFGWSTHEHDDAAGPGDLTLTDVTAGQRVTLANGNDAGYKVVPDQLSSGTAGAQRVVDAKYPYLLMRAKTAATAQVIIKVVSDAIGGQ